MMHILIAENDPRTAQSLQQLLQQDRYETTCVRDGIEALREALRRPYALILMDVLLPEHNGFGVIRELRRLRIQTPILILSALNTTEKKVEGLDCGADDYLTKPFEPDELLARIRALIRRSLPLLPPELQYGDLIFRLGSATLHCGELEIRLNYKETEILKLLMSFPQHILSKEELIHKVWGYASSTSDNNVEAYISFLRKKLNLLGSRVSIIAIKKQGYKLEYKPI